MKISTYNGLILNTSYSLPIESTIQTFGALSQSIVFIDNYTTRIEIDADHYIPEQLTYKWFKSLAYGIKAQACIGSVYQHFLNLHNQQEPNDIVRKDVALFLGELDSKVTFSLLDDFISSVEALFSLAATLPGNLDKDIAVANADELYAFFHRYLGTIEEPSIVLNKEEEAFLDSIANTIYDYEYLNIYLNDDEFNVSIRLPVQQDQQDLIYSFLPMFETLAMSAEQDKFDYVSNSADAIKFINEVYSYYILNVKIQALREAKFSLDNAGISYDQQAEALDGYFYTVSTVEESISKRIDMINNIDSFLNAFGFEQSPTILLNHFGLTKVEFNSYQIKFI